MEYLRSSIIVALLLALFRHYFLSKLFSSLLINDLV